MGLQSDYLSKVLQPFAKDLAEIERRLTAECNSSHFEIINEAARRITLDNGKRLRPVLILETAKMLGGIQEAHLVFSVIIELIHTATLVHDDVLDDAFERRHKMSVNAQWGNETSVMLGDYLFARALTQLSTLASGELLSVVSEATRDLCEGELIQIQTARNVHLSPEIYYEIIRRKTASLFAACCYGAARISGSSLDVAETLRNFGVLIGEAFQIVDDILDLVGDSSSEGKTLRTDLMNGKMTLPLIHLVRALEDDEKKMLERVIEGRENAGFLDIQQILSRGTYLQETYQEVENLCRRSLDLLLKLPPSVDHELFSAVPEFLVNQARRLVSDSVILKEPARKS